MNEQTMQRTDSEEAADYMLQARRAAARAGYHTRPLVVETVSGLLPADERKLRGVYALPPREAREERVAVPTREVVCYECGRRSHIPTAALSAHCVHCRTHLNTADITLKPGSRRLTIRTLGDVTLPANVDLSHLSIHCRNMIACGKGKGALHCTGTLTLRGNARLEGQVQAGLLRVASGAHAVVQPGAAAEEAELEGSLTGHLHVKGALHIGRGGQLIGDARAQSRSISPGGQHDGSWTRC